MTPPSVARRLARFALRRFLVVGRAGQAQVGQLRHALRREQERIDEALALFSHAADLLRDMGEGEAEAWARLELGGA